MPSSTDLRDSSSTVAVAGGDPSDAAGGVSELSTMMLPLGISLSGGVPSLGVDWWFHDSGVRKKQARGVPEFHDTSLFSGLPGSEGSSSPWPFEVGRRVVASLRGSSDDGPPYRFFVGGAACSDPDVYLQLSSTAWMCRAYREALLCDPREHGSAPWVAVMSACKDRGGGVASGPPLPIVGASRDAAYQRGVDAALAVFDLGVGGGRCDAEFCERLLGLVADAGKLSPIDGRKVFGRLCACRVRGGIEAASAIGADGSDVDGLVSACGLVLVWRSGCDGTWDPDVAEGHDAGFESLLSAVRQHHGDALHVVLERERAGYARVCGVRDRCHLVAG